MIHGINAIAPPTIKVNWIRPHAPRHRWWKHFVKRTLQPLNQIAPLSGRHRRDAGIREHTIAVVSHAS
jgi:hypothetical protein